MKMILLLLKNDGTKKGDKTMPRKPKVKPPEQDFNKKLEDYKKRISENEQLVKDPLLTKLLEEFQRMTAINNNLWDDITVNGYFIQDVKGNTVINPSIAAYNKNLQMLLKTIQYIDEKTKTLVLTDGVKSW